MEGQTRTPCIEVAIGRQTRLVGSGTRGARGCVSRTERDTGRSIDLTKEWTTSDRKRHLLASVTPRSEPLRR